MPIYGKKTFKNLLLRTKNMWSQKLTYVTHELNRARRDSRGDEREGQGRKREMKKWRNRRNNNIPPLPLPAARTCPTLSQYQLGDPVTEASYRTPSPNPTTHMQTLQMLIHLQLVYVHKNNNDDIWSTCTYSLTSIYIMPYMCGYITKTHLYNFDPLTPHFYIVKRGFTGVYIIFLISA